MSYSSEFSEQGHMLPQSDTESVFCSENREKRKNSLPNILLGAILSLIISVLATLLTHHILRRATFGVTKEDVSFLPELNIPKLGNVESVFTPGQIYREPPSNLSHEAWMQLFPKGKGYISTTKLEKVGPLPDFINNMQTDGSGRFCIASFHQLHCVYLIQTDLFDALEGKIKKPGPHTLHCIDYLRESIMCAADTTLEPFKSSLQGFSGGDSVDGFGTPHQCRNFDHLYAWAEKFRYNDMTDADHFNG